MVPWMDFLLDLVKEFELVLMKVDQTEQLLD